MISVTSEKRIVVEGSAKVHKAEKVYAVYFISRYDRAGEAFAQAALWLEENPEPTVVGSNTDYDWEDDEFIFMLFVEE